MAARRVHWVAQILQAWHRSEFHHYTQSFEQGVTLFSLSLRYVRAFLTMLAICITLDILLHIVIVPVLEDKAGQVSWI